MTKPLNIKKSAKKFKQLQYKKLPKMIKISALITSLVFFMLYASTAPLTNVAYNNGDLFLVLAKNLGLANPPGYALYITLLHFIESLPLPLNFALKGHLLSAVLNSTSLFFITISSWRVIKYFQLNSRITKKFTDIHILCISLLSSIMIGSNYIFWLYGSITNKISIITTIFAILIYILINISLYKIKDLNSWLIPMGILSGLLFSYHLSTWTLIPALGYILWKLDLFKFTKNRGTVFYFFGGLLGSIILIIILNIGINSLHSDVSWVYPSNLTKIVQTLIHSDFTGTPISAVNQSQTKILNINQMLINIPQYIKTLYNYLGLEMILFIILGFIYLLRFKKFGYTIIIAFISVSIIYPLYVGIPIVEIDFSNVINHYLFGFPIIAILITSGIWILFEKIYLLEKLVPKKNNKIFKYLFIYAVPLLLIWTQIDHIYAMYPKMNLKHFNFVNRFYSNVLTDLPQNSLIACFDDTSCFALMYSQEIEGVRKDITILPLAHQLVDNKLSQIPNFRGFDYKLKPFVITDPLTWNIGKRPVFVINLPNNYSDTLGNFFGFTFYLPTEYVGELTHQLPNTLPKYDYDFSHEMLNTHIPEIDKMKIGIKKMIAKNHQTNALYYLRMDQRNRTIDELNIMNTLLHQISYLDTKDIEANRIIVERGKPFDSYKLGSHSQDVEQIQKNVEQFLSKGKLNYAYKGALGIVTVDPTNVKGRIQLAEIYNRLGDNDLAKIEYQNALKLDPNNKQVEKILQNWGENIATSSAELLD